MITFALEVSALRASLYCSAVNDIRYYLNGACIESCGAGVAIVCTDGHRLSVLNQPQAFAVLGLEAPAEPFSIILPCDELERAMKAMPKPLRGQPPEPIVITLDAGKVSMRIGATAIECQAVDGKFPDWRRVVPSTIGGQDGDSWGFDADYLADFAKVCRALGAKRGHGFTIGQSTTSAALITISGHPEYFAVLMPVRNEKPSVPEWANCAPAAEPKSKAKRKAAAEPVKAPEPEPVAEPIAAPVVPYVEPTVNPYAARVAELEAEGMSTSDAQAVADAEEFMRTA